VQSFIVTPNQVLAEFEKQTGGEKWKVTRTSLDDIRTGEAKAWEEGNPRAVSYTLRRIWAEGSTLYEKNDNSVVELEEGSGELETLSQAVKKGLEGGYKADTF